MVRILVSRFEYIMRIPSKNAAMADIDICRLSLKKG